MLSVKEIWYEFSEKLLGFIQSKVETDEDAQDILQDVFLKVSLKLDSFDPGSNLNAWLYTITRNQINDFYRERGKKKVPEIPVEDKQPLPFCCLDPHIASLPEKYRKVIFLSEVKGLKHAEIAASLGLSISAIKSRVVRGRELLKNKFVECCKYHLNAEGKLVGEPDCDSEHCNS
ncbi:MAG: sigma-70 family RNA polymerase sigma factor [Flavobacteriales bacterium]|nr:sigma-70 family RNA polymerase sigma factor [Flavobacteriales bacterium]